MEILDSFLKLAIGEESFGFWAAAQTLVLAVTLALVYRQVLIQRQANTLDTLRDLDEMWNSEQMIRSRKAVCGKYATDDLDIRRTDQRVFQFFESLGLYLRRRVFDVDTVWELYSFHVECYWIFLEPAIREFRAVTQDDTWYTNFEYLYRRICTHSKKKGGPTIAKSRKEIESFVASELDLLKKDFVERTDPTRSSNNIVA